MNNHERNKGASACGAILIELMAHMRRICKGKIQGNPNGGLAKGGLAQEVLMRPKRPLLGHFLLVPSGCEARRN